MDLVTAKGFTVDQLSGAGMPIGAAQRFPSAVREREKELLRERQREEETKRREAQRVEDEKQREMQMQRACSAAMKAAATGSSAAMEALGLAVMANQSYSAMPPNAPSSMLISNLTENGFTIGWDAPKSPTRISEYEVLMGGCSIAKTSAVDSDRTWTVSRLNPLSRVEMAVRAKNSAGWGRFADGFTVQTHGTISGIMKVKAKSMFGDSWKDVNCSYSTQTKALVYNSSDHTIAGMHLS
jgi:hypothetical protein